MAKRFYAPSPSPSRSLRGQIAGASLVIFLVYTGQFMAYPFIPLYIVERGGGPFDVGLIMSLNLILAAILSVPMGALSDRWGRKAVILLGAGIAAVGHFLLPLATTPLTILSAYLIAGLGHAAYGPVTAAIVGDLASSREIGTAFGFTQAARRTGNLVGPALGGFLAASFGVSPVFVICGVFLTSGAVVANLALRGLKVPAGSESSQNARVSPGAGYTTPFRDPVIIAAATGTLTSSFVFLGYGSFIPLLTKNLGATTSYIGNLFALQALMSILARLPIGRYSDRTGRRAPLVVVGLVVSALGMTLTASITDLLILMSLAALIGLGDAFGGATGNVIIAERSGVRSRGATFGINNTAIYAGQAFGSIFTGAVIAGHGFEVGFRSLALLLLTSALIFCLVARRANIR